MKMDEFPKVSVAHTAVEVERPPIPKSTEDMKHLPIKIEICYFNFVEGESLLFHEKKLYSKVKPVKFSRKHRIPKGISGKIPLVVRQV